MGNNDYFNKNRINDINVESPDLFLKLLDKKAKLEKDDEDLFPKVLKNEKIKEEASRSNDETGKRKRDKARKSSQTNIPTSKKGKKPAGKVIKDNWKGFVAGALSAVIIISATNFINDRIKKDKKAEVAKNAAMEIFERNGLTTTNEKGETVVNFSNDTEDYAKMQIDDTNPASMRGYYEALDRNNKEFGEFIEGVTYEDGLYYYTGLNQFLEINGYFNRDGSTSIDEFIVYTNNILKDMDDEAIEELIESSVQKNNTHTKG